MSEPVQDDLFSSPDRLADANPSEVALIDSACRLVDAARLPANSWGRSKCYQACLENLAGHVDLLRQDDDHTAMPAKLDTDWDFVADGQAMVSVDLGLYLAQAKAAGILTHLDHRTPDDIARATAEIDARRAELHRLRGDSAAGDIH